MEQTVLSFQYNASGNEIYVSYLAIGIKKKLLFLRFSPQGVSQKIKTVDVF